MARSALMNALLRAVRAAGASNTSASRPRGLSPEITRRGLLVGGLAITGATVACKTKSESVPPVLAEAGLPTPPTASVEDAGVVVVGGGIAGLLCAYRLKQSGVAARLFEAYGRVGGRIMTVRSSFADNQIAELGGELIDTGHRTLHALAPELGLQLADLRAGSEALEPVFLFGNRRLSERDIVAALRPVVKRIKAEVDALGSPDVPYKATGVFRERDAWSIDEWLKRNRVEGPAADVIRIAFTTELGLEPEQLSCIPMLQMVAIEANKLHLYGDSDEKYHVRGGNDQITESLAKALGDTVLQGTALEAMSRLPDGRVLLSFQRGAGHLEIRADRVVLALPFSILRSVKIDDNVGLSERKKQSIRELGYGTNAKLILGFKSRLWKTKRLTGEIFSDLPFQSTWDGSRAQPGDAGMLTVFTGGTRGLNLKDASQRKDETLEQLDQVVPGLRAEADGRAVGFHWPTYPGTLGSYSTWKVGQMTAFGGVEQEVEGGNVHFAGEHTSLAFQGFMEGGAESGERAAKEVLKALGKTSSPVAPPEAGAPR